MLANFLKRFDLEIAVGYRWADWQPVTQTKLADGFLKICSLYAIHK